MVGLSNISSRIPETDSRDPGTEIGSLERRVRTWYTWYTGKGITKDPSQPGGPHKGARRIVELVASQSPATKSDSAEFS